jgi:hypothetical protein
LRTFARACTQSTIEKEGVMKNCYSNVVHLH